MSFTLPPAALSQHIACVGKTGSGKTYSFKAAIVEPLLAERRRVCIIDPTGAWWGLRSSADGKRPGFPVVVFGGDHADVPINAHAGAALGELVGTKNMPAVIDLSGMMIGERRRFITEFAEDLYRTNRDPLHLVIDEADEFAPQRPVGGDEVMLHRIDRIVRRGRSRGFRVGLITQRPAVLHKNVLTQAATLIAMRLPAPQDRKAIMEWVKGQADEGQAAEVIGSLSRLERGEGWVWFPEGAVLNRVKFPRIRTFDSSRTPEDGERIAEPSTLADVDLTAINAALEEAAKAAAENDPKALRKRIADLERELSAKPRPAADPKAVERAVAAAKAECNRAADVVAKRLKADADRAGARLARLVPEINAAMDDVRAVIEGVVGFARVTDGIGRASTPDPVARPVSTTPTHNPTRVVNRPATADNGHDLPKGERATLAALIQYPDGLRRSQLTVLTGYKRSARDTYIQRLRSRGYVETNGERVNATAAGMSALPDAETLPTGEALRAFWMDRLPAGERAVLRVLIERYPETVAHEEIDRETDYRRSARDTYLQRLRAKQLVTTERGASRASDTLFE